jgi:hypothetical protein
LHQGDSLSPLLFNIVVDMLAILIKRAKLASQINGVVPHLVDDGLSILQYTDTTIIFFRAWFRESQEFKDITMCFWEIVEPKD